MEPPEWKQKKKTETKIFLSLLSHKQQTKKFFRADEMIFS